MSEKQPKTLEGIKSISGWAWIIGVYCTAFICVFLWGKGAKGVFEICIQGSRDIFSHVSPYPVTDYASSYKYSPLFSIFCYPFHFFSSRTGVVLWQTLNFGLFFWGVLAFSSQFFRDISALLDRPYKFLIFLALISNELLGSLLNGQFNPMLSGMMLLGLVFYNQGRFLAAGAILAIASNFKLFPLCLALLLLWDFRPGYWVSFIGSSLLALILPALFLGWDWNQELVVTWLSSLTGDYAGHGSLSLLRFLRIHFGFQQENLYYAFIFLNVILLCAGYRWSFSAIRTEGAKNLYPLVALFILLFNHRSESALFVFISPAFAFLYLGVLEKRREGGKALPETALLSFCYFIISLGYSDLVPDPLIEWFNAAHMKTFGAMMLYGYYAIEAIASQRTARGSSP